MALKRVRPTSPGRRDAVRPDFQELTTRTPFKALTKGKSHTGGRNSRGKITVYHRGGGAKQSWRDVDFKRDKSGIPCRVETIEYDPNRSAYISLIHYEDGEKRYIIAPSDLPVGSYIVSGEKVPLKVGNALKLFNIPTGLLVHNVEMIPGKGGQMVRGAGTSAQLLAKEGKYVLIRLPSGETRQVLAECSATIGQVGAADHKNIKLGKAGRKRNRGWRPSVRGVVMSPADHPHGGGEGKSPIGMPSPKTPWGKPALGLVTRKRKKNSSKFIVKSRRSK